MPTEIRMLNWRLIKVNVTTGVRCIDELCACLLPSVVVNADVVMTAHLAYIGQCYPPPQQSMKIL